MSTNSKIAILIATHKQYPMPKEEIYIPIHVGCAGKENLGYTGDNTGDHISEKNSTWCELTGLYWGWKNLDCNYMGLVQYRRYFMLHRKLKLFDSILTKCQVEELLQRADIILPKKRNYWIMTLEEHFNGYDFTIPSDMKNFREAIHAVSPEYDEAVDIVMRRRSGHMCNMFIMKRNLLDHFCRWEFQVLFEFERRLGENRNRLIGYVAEHMLDIWIEKNKYQYVECPVASLDKKNEIQKRIDFLMRKAGLKFRLIRLPITK